MTSPRIERRLAAILALDVAGYSQLMGVDEVGTLTALKAHRRERIDPAITRHNGRIVTTTGDGLLVEFASVVDAVAGAVAIQRAMLAFNADIPADRQIVLRIGINVGDIIIDGDDIFGDGVNVAARLEALCEPGGVCISRSANDQVRDRLSLAFADLGEHTVKNISRAVGVFGLAASDIAALPHDALPALPPSAPARPARVGQAKLAAGIAVMVSILVIGGWWMLHTRTPPPAVASAVAAGGRAAPTAKPDRRGSLIVLPFETAGGDGGQRSVAAAITRDVTERIAADRGWPVASAATAARYRGKKPDLRAIGLDQNVHFALTGGVREQDGRLLVLVTLYQTQDDQAVWSQQFDNADDRDLPAAIIAGIANGVHQAIIDAEVARARREHPDRLDAPDLYFASLQSALIPLTKPAMAARVALLDQALAVDPGYVPALAMDARLRAVMVLNDWSTDRETDLAYATKTVDGLLESRPRDVYHLRTKAYVLRAQGNLDQALAVNRRVIAINPLLADSHREIGVILHGQGHFEEALASFQAARQIVDGDYLLDAQTARAALATDRFAEAISLARRALAQGPGSELESPWLTLIAAQAAGGQDAQARADMQKYLAATPALRTLAEVRKESVLAGTPNLLEGLRRAGMPEE